MEMPRRRFLGLAGTAAAGLAAGPALAAAPAARAAPLKKACKLSMIQDRAPLVRKLEIAREVGFDGVEVESPNQIETDYLLKARDQARIELPGVIDSEHWKKPLTSARAEVRAEGVEALLQALRDCKAYGGSTVLLVAGRVDKSTHYDEAWRRSQAEIKKVLPVAESLGVKIAIENVWNEFLLSPLEAVRYLDELGSDAVGWYLDIGNVWNHGYPDQWIRILGDRILRLDVKGYSRKKRDDEGLWRGFEVEIDEGDIDWAAVRTALAEIGYQGWATAEVEGGTAERLRDVAERMDRVLNG